jgi:hypothetical protein
LKIGSGSHTSGLRGFYEYLGRKLVG